MKRICHFDPERKYRYTLWREWWRDALPRPLCRDCADHDGICPFSGNYCDPAAYLMVIGLNPSTADEERNDPTVTGCIEFAKRWKFGALCMTNIFAWRDTDPKKMKAAAEPVGPENDAWLLRCADGAGMILAAWGKHGAHLGRAKAVVDLLQARGHSLVCLAVNNDGSPKHPLYVARKTFPQPFQPIPPRFERCHYCGEMVADWVDPDWARGRVCLRCEPKHEPKLTR